MNKDQFGLGIVGAGFITQESHAPSVEYLPGVHVAGIQNRTLETAAELADTCRDEGWGDPSVYGEGEIDALVADPDVDGLWITTPNFVRQDSVEAAVRAVDDGGDLAGIAIEKPLARTLSEADAIVQRIEDAGLAHAYLENWVHEPRLRELRSLLWERGRGAGRPYIARARAEHGGPHSAWFWNGEKQGGGVLTDMLSHALSTNERLLTDPEGGDLEAVSVSADAETLKWNHGDFADELEAEFGVDLRENPVDDYARATVQYEDSSGRTIVSEATGSWCYVGAGVNRSIELLGPEYSGQVVSNGSESSVFFSDALSGGEGWAEKQNATSGRMPLAAADVVLGGYVAENRDAVDAFRRGENATLDLRHGRDILRLCLAAYKSAETEATVDPRNADLEGYTPPPARR
ncbi:Gfo/Idh/MocA family protein [Halorubrum rubrum]|uniref:Gfo/Idh/MocA family protein n=1 Tax=Halorubrum rubrum TaxID=1126240 RepID=A0ABD5QZK0_9EURY|nr:Gfo/Idh/MocA family oxidoreductase [Halorubrum rubrum]